MKFLAFFLVLAVCRAAPQGFQDETQNVDTFLRKVSSEAADSVVEQTIRKLVEGAGESSFASGGSANSGSVSQAADVSSFGTSGGLSSGGFSSGGFSSGGFSSGAQGFSSGAQGFSSDFSGANQAAVVSQPAFAVSNVGASEGFSSDAAAVDAFSSGSAGASVINVGVDVEDSSDAATATRFSDNVEQPTADKFVKKYFYFGLPDARKKEPQLVKTFKQPGEVRHNVIFIKTPSTGSSRSVLLNQQGQVQEKTLVYVLVKEGEEDAALPQPQPLGLPKAHKPEVVFVKYKNNKKASSGNFGDSFGARFGGASNVGAVRTASDFSANSGFGSGNAGFVSGNSGFGSGVTGFGTGNSGFGTISSGNSGFVDGGSTAFRSGSSGGSGSSIQIIPGNSVGGQISEDRINSELSDIGGLRNLEGKFSSGNTVTRTF